MSGVLSITTTKRRRFLWCAWWTGEPTRLPFRAPDAWNGGSRSEAEARKAAEKAAGAPLVSIEPIWARAWVRVAAGNPPWVTRAPRRPRAEEPPRQDPRDRLGEPRTTAFEGCPFTVLGLSPTATALELTRAFRRLALATHPDRGGAPGAFIRVKHAYDAARARKGA